MENNKEKSLHRAEEHARTELSKIDIVKQSELLDLDYNNQTELINLHAFGTNITVNTENYFVSANGSESELSLLKRIIVLHYLLCKTPVNETGKIISFRELPGGQFYYDPFRARSVNPLASRIGNKIELIKKGLDVYNWIKYDAGDFGAKIHIIGNIYFYLIYWKSDNEFESRADLHFDSCIKHVFSTDDVAAIASRVCFSLIH